MNTDNINDITLEDVTSYAMKNADAIIVADGRADTYRALARRGLFVKLLDADGSYLDLIEKLWYHFNNSSDTVIEDYRVFIPTAGKFVGKYSRRINISFEGVTHVVQMTVYPVVSQEVYILLLDELDGSQYIDETLTTKKVSTIQNTYLFSMYVDLIKDTTNSISITELSDDVQNQQLKYSEWRKMIVNMIGPDDQAIFLERTDPEYLKKNLAVGRTSSYDCLMKNLEGRYIWVKLIFRRAETINPDDFRFVFMVQDIHESAEELMTALKTYEDLALKDPLTGIYNHRQLETEMDNTIEDIRVNGGSAAMMILDIDYFKRVNDVYGHAAGDKALIHFAEVITDFISSRKAVAGRWGGEEFIVVLDNADSEEAISTANALRQRIEEEPFGKIGHITCSIGVTVITADDNVTTAFERMDKAVYEAKSAGRNCIKTVFR